MEHFLSKQIAPAVHNRLFVVRRIDGRRFDNAIQAADGLADRCDGTGRVHVRQQAPAGKVTFQDGRWPITCWDDGDRLPAETGLAQVGFHRPTLVVGNNNAAVAG